MSLLRDVKKKLAVAPGAMMLNYGMGASWVIMYAYIKEAISSCWLQNEVEKG